MANLEATDQDEFNSDPERYRESLESDKNNDPLLGAIVECLEANTGLCLDDEADRYLIAYALRDAVLAGVGD